MKATSTDLAAQLLGSAIRDSEAPVMEMAGALARINGAVVRARAAASGDDCGCRELTDDIALCIQSLQFHDRLIQQLTAVRRLMGSAPMEGELASGFMPPAEGTIELF